MTDTFKSILIRTVVRRTLQYKRMGWTDDQITEVVDLEFTHIEKADGPKLAATSNTQERNVT